MAGRIAYTGNIVRDGLVLLLDAAKRDSYPGSGTTWRDLSGNENNGTLTNGPTFNSDNNGSIAFDGTNDEVVFSGVNFGTLTSFTIGGFIKPILGNDTTGTVANNSNNFSPYGWHCRVTSEAVRFWVNLVHQDGIALDSDVWNFFAITVTTSNIVHYKNGIVNNSYNGTYSFTTNNATFRIGKWEGGSYYYKGNMANFYYYNRALSATEITQNFNALRGRYGI